MNDLIEFLKARLAEDEQRAADVRAVMGIHSSGPLHMPGTVFTEVEVYGTRRARAEVAVKRAIIELHEVTQHIYRKAPGCGPDQPAWACDVCDWTTDPDGYRELDYNFKQACETVRLMAEVYRSHPEWREEWAA